jgi:hypothetical protein
LLGEPFLSRGALERVPFDVEASAAVTPIMSSSLISITVSPLRVSSWFSAFAGPSTAPAWSTSSSSLITNGAFEVPKLPVLVLLLAAPDFLRFTGLPAVLVRGFGVLGPAVFGERSKKVSRDLEGVCSAVAGFFGGIVGGLERVMGMDDLGTDTYNGLHHT